MINNSKQAISTRNLDKIVAVRTSKTMFKDGSQLIKMFGEEYQKSDILNEAMNQSRVEEAGLNVPKIISVTQVNGKWSIISEYIKGKTLDRIMKEDPNNLEEYLDLFIKLQIQIHNISIPVVNKLKDKLHRNIEKSELRATKRYSLRMSLAAMPKHKKLCHGDFNPSNIIIGDDGLYYIIDWSHVTQGNAAADSVMTYLLFKLDGQNDLADQYLTRYCELTSTSMDYIRKWIPIVAASQSAKSNQIQKELLLKWVHGVDII